MVGADNEGADKPIRPLRVAIVSPTHESALGECLGSALVAIGHQTRVFPEPRPLLHQAVTLRLPRRLPRPLVRWAQAELDAYGPDLILVVKGSFVSAQDVQQMKELAPTVCWNPDSPFDFALSNSGGLIHDALCEYSAYVTWSASLRDSIADLRDQVYRIPFAADSRQLGARPGTCDEVAGRVVLVGTATAERARIVRSLQPLNPVVFGHGWARYGVEARQPQYGDAMLAVAKSAKWCLNPLRPQNRDSHNMRTFELAACGAAQLTYETADHREFLRGHRHQLVSGSSELLDVASEWPEPADHAPDVPVYEDRVGELLRLLRADGFLPAVRS